MATRLYFPSSGTALVTPATWNFANQINPLTFKGGTYQNDGSAATTKVEATGTTSPTTRAMLRYVYGPLAAQTIAGTIKAQMLAAESATGANANIGIAIKIIKPDGTDRAVLLAQTSSTNNAATPPELAATLTNRRFLDASDNAAIALTSQSSLDGDYLVVEIGFRSATTTTRNISLSYGNAISTDLPEDDTTTAVDNPWIEFSQTLQMFQPVFFKYPWKERSPVPFPIGTSQQQYVPPSGNNVSVGLSGLAATMAIGTIVAQFLLAPAGVQAAGNVGLGPPTMDVASTGVGGTSAIGTETPGFSFTPTGQSATGSVGTVTSPGWSEALTGSGGTSAIGTVVAENDEAPAGLAGTGSPGSLGLTDSSPLGGLIGASGLGSLSLPSTPINVDRPKILRGPWPFPMATPAWALNAPVSGTVALTGVQASVIVNDFNDVLVDTPPFAGQAGTALLGSVGPSTPGSAALTGVVGNGGAGILVATLPMPLVGVEGDTALGTLTPIRSSVDNPIVQVGPFPFLGGKFQFRERPRLVAPPSQSLTIILAGQQATSGLSSLALVLANIPEVGSAGTGVQGTETPVFAISLSGIAATGSLGSLGIAASLTGVQGAGALGNEVATITVPLTGVQAAGVLGAITAQSNNDSTVGIVGNAAVATIGAVLATNTEAVSGLSTTGANGSTGSADTVIFASGVGGSGQIGTISTGTGQVTLSEVGATASIGSVGAAPGPILVGFAVSGQLGIIGIQPFIFILQGVEGTGEPGGFVVDLGSVLDFVGEFRPINDYTGEFD